MMFVEGGEGVMFFFNKNPCQWLDDKNSNLSLLLSLLVYDLHRYYMLKGFLKARRPPKVSNEIKCTNKKMT